MLPVMIFSFTGASLHVHICSETGETYSDIHLLSFQYKLQQSECLAGIDARNTKELSCCSGNDHDKVNCSIPENYDNHENLHSYFCIDIEQKIETDNNYKFSHHTVRLDPIEISSLFPGIPDTKILQSKEQVYSSANSFVSPPKLHSSVVLLL